MIRIYDADNGRKLGTITDEQLVFLIDQLEEESSTDTDYYINTVTLDMFETKGAESRAGAANGRVDLTHSGLRIALLEPRECLDPPTRCSGDTASQVSDLDFLASQ